VFLGVFSFPNMGIQQCKMQEFAAKLEERRALEVNPFGSKYAISNNTKN